MSALLPLIGGIGGLLVVVWALWERNGRTKAIAKAEKTQQRLEALDKAHTELIGDYNSAKVRSASAEQFLEKEIRKADEAQRPIHGDALERLRDVLRPSAKTISSPDELPK